MREQNSGPQAEPKEQGFAPVTSQADLDRIIQEQVARAVAGFADYDAIKKQLTDIEDASRSDLERAQKRAEEAERLAAEATASALRARISSSKGVPEALLTGATEEEMTAVADQLIAFRGDPADTPESEGAGRPPPPRPADPAQHGEPLADEQRVREAFARQLFQI